MLRVIVIGFLMFPSTVFASWQKEYHLGEDVQYYQGCEKPSALIALVFMHDRFLQQEARDLFKLYRSNGYCGHYPLTESQVNALEQVIQEDEKAVWYQMPSKKVYFFWPLRPQPLEMTYH